LEASNTKVAFQYQTIYSLSPAITNTQTYSNYTTESAAHCCQCYIVSPENKPMLALFLASRCKD